MTKHASTPYDYPLSPGRRLIEASAGTGKTFTIVELYRRLILERKFRVKDILVVTFSKAATAELKERISAGLNTALRDGWEDENKNIIKPTLHEQLLLQLAIASFDEAAISTIHGFCQKALTDFAVESGESLSMTLAANNDEFIDKLIKAFWRKEFGHAETTPPVTIETLQNLAKKITTYANSDEKIVTPQDHLYVRFLDYLRENLPGLKRDAAVIQFDDLVTRLRDALRDPVSGERLAHRICSRYKAVFVDEFQDTDEAQYEVFDRCFPQNSNTVFFMIGDPKQAIYAFRGADIYAYLRAKNEIEGDHQYTLTKNYRSAPELLRAVSELFSGNPDADVGTEFQNAFLQDGIPFVQVESGRKKEDFLITENGQPIKDHFISRFHIGTKSATEPLIIYDTAREIASLLSEERNIRIKPEQRPLKASDIAVLVQKHDQGLALQKELQRYNINAAASDQSNVFTSPEALELENVLYAVLEPNGNQVRNAMLSDFYQCPIEIVDSAVQATQESPLESWKLFFHSLGEIWRTRGFAAMFTTLLDSVPETFQNSPRMQILSGENGERAMTNYLHLMELLRRIEISNNFAPENTLDHLKEARLNNLKTSSPDADKSTDPDASEMRLDKDSDTVQIVTLFASKGLQYPIVFLPFPVFGPAQNRHPAEVGYQTRDAERAYFDYQEEPDAMVLDKYKSEKLRTQLRLLYVALTRAEYLCFTDFTLLPDNARSNADNLLHSAAGHLCLKQNPGISAPDRIKKIFELTKGMPAPEIIAPWINNNADSVKTEIEPALTVHNPGTLRQPQTEIPEEFSALEKPVIPHSWHVMSYTSFHYGAHSSGGIRDLDENDSTDSGKQGKEKENEKPVFHDFLRGSSAGTFLHNMLEYLLYPANGNPEKLTFADFAENTEKEDKINQYLQKQLSFIGQDTPLRLLQLREGLDRLFTTPLTEEQFCLSSINPNTALAELEFTLNIPDKITLKKILASIKTHGDENMQILSTETTVKNSVNGLLNGVIDLLFLHNGKYYIADYKTNRLESYSKASVWKVMADCGYILQAYLYTIAFYRLMQQRKADFSYQNDFGGILYLFPKGMDHHGHGIWYHTPSEACIKEILNLTGNGAV